MNPIHGGNGSSAQVERAFAEYLFARSGGASVDFESFCAQHAEVGEELRRLGRIWDRLVATPEDGEQVSTFSQRIRERYGKEVDLEITLDRETDESSLDILGRAEHDAAERTVLGRYPVKGELAQGGMGVVLLVWDEDLRRNLAMKTLHRGRTGADSHALARFLEEARVTGQLDHPGIVPVHELGLDAGGRVFFTMKLVKGVTLTETFRRLREEGTRPGARALNLVLRICEAMAYAHAKGVIHRDLKPDNVMIGRFGEVYVMDWGLARIVGRPAWSEDAPAGDDSERGRHGSTMTMDGDVVGTPAYMSPEQAMGRLADVGPASDVYSVGAILYHLLAGRMPYSVPEQAITPREVLLRVSDGPPEPIDMLTSDAPSELVAICEKAMAREPDRRYATMEELSEDIHAFLEGRVVRAFETGALAELRKWVARNRVVAAAIAVTILVALGGLSWTARVQAEAGRRLQAKNEQLAQANALILEKHEQAVRNEREALAAKRRADDRAAEILRLSDMQNLEELTTRADALWPARPSMIPDYEAWIAQAERLVSRLEDDQTMLAAIRERSLSWTDDEREADLRSHPRSEELQAQRTTVEELAAELEEAERRLVSGAGGDEGDLDRLLRELERGQAELDELELELARRRTWSFHDVRDQWWHDQLSQLTDDLFEFAEPERGSLANVRRLLAFAGEIEELTVTGVVPRRLWAEALADVAASAVYAGFELAPQLGLLPVGKDPVTGLWEFADLATGVAPARDPGTGELVMTEDCGVVFVLLPGGTFHLGCQGRDPAAPNYDPLAQPDELAHQVKLAPFLFSKYELNQGQWLRFTGENPSFYGLNTDLDRRRNSLLHPVEQVSWVRCAEVLRQLGFVFPTEAQWEYAARAGTQGSWFTGSERDSLVGGANLADASAARAGASWQNIRDWPELDDGWPVHAPVDSLAPNGFGLHHVHGNVWEWCREGYGAYSLPVRPGDGERQVSDTRYRMSRGGGFGSSAAQARSAIRRSNAMEYRSGFLGVRPARELD